MISSDPLSVLMRGIQARHLDWGAGAEAVQPASNAFSRAFEDGSAPAAAGVPAGAAPAAAVSEAGVDDGPADAAALPVEAAALETAGEDKAGTEQIAPAEVAAAAADPEAEPSAATPVGSLPAQAPGLVVAGHVRADPSGTRTAPDAAAGGGEADGAAAEAAIVPEGSGRVSRSRGEIRPEDGVPAERTREPSSASAFTGPASPAGGGPSVLASAPASVALAPGEVELGWRLNPESAVAIPARDVAGAATGAPSAPPSAVAGQVAMAIRASESDRIEIRLDPPELGRVQIEMRVVEGALHAVVVAERSEISDLLRRHAEMLQRDLEAAGYGGVSLDFAAGRQDGSERRNDARGGGRPLDAVALAPVAAQAVRALGDGRLDIRF